MFFPAYYNRLRRRTNHGSAISSRKYRSVSLEHGFAYVITCRCVASYAYVQPILDWTGYRIEMRYRNISLNLI